MAETGFILDPRFLEHDTGLGHPERPDRIGVLLQSVVERPGLVRLAPRVATAEEILLVHEEGHLADVQRTSGAERSAFDADTPASARSFDVARLAAGGLLSLLDAVMSGEHANGFALVRPPGHHAERARAMGFCLFNNAAIGAAYLRSRHGLERVLVVDWDVHHGNGTQHAFERDAGILYVSTHRFPFYPGTGAIDEVGVADGEGFTVNVPFPGGFGDAEYADAFHTVIEPIAEQFDPQFVLISAGFDPHARDPLGGMHVTEDGFRAMARSLIGVAERTCGGRCVAVLEGGYDLDALRDSTGEVLRELQGDRSALLSPSQPSSAGPVLEAVRRVQGRYWKV